MSLYLVMALPVFIEEEDGREMFDFDQPVGGGHAVVAFSSGAMASSVARRWTAFYSEVPTSPYERNTGRLLCSRGDWTPSSEEVAQIEAVEGLWKRMREDLALFAGLDRGWAPDNQRYVFDVFCLPLYAPSEYELFTRGVDCAVEGELQVHRVPVFFQPSEGGHDAW